MIVFNSCFLVRFLFAHFQQIAFIAQFYAQRVLSIKRLAASHIENNSRLDITTLCHSAEEQSLVWPIFQLHLRNGNRTCFVFTVLIITSSGWIIRTNSYRCNVMHAHLIVWRNQPHSQHTRMSTVCVRNFIILRCEKMQSLVDGTWQLFICKTCSILR